MLKPCPFCGREAKVHPSAINCSSCGATSGITDWNTRHLPPDVQRVLDAAKVIAKWMEFWLHEDLCECEDTHSCGKLERRAELLSYHDAVDAMEVSDEY